MTEQPDGTRPDPDRPDPARPDQTRADHSRQNQSRPRLPPRWGGLEAGDPTYLPPAPPPPEPERPHAPPRTPSYATTGVLIAVNVAVWLLIRSTGGLGSAWFDRLALRPMGACVTVEGPAGYYPELTEPLCRGVGLWFGGVANGAPWQVVTNIFAHEDPVHLGMNMLALVMLGPAAENVLGRTRFLTIYLLSGLAGSALVYWLAPVQTQTLGASGAIFGLLGCLLVLTLRGRANPGGVLVWLAINIVYTFIGENISWQGHIGGLLGGLVLAWVLTASRVWLRWAGTAAVAIGLIVAFVARTAQLT